VRQSFYINLSRTSSAKDFCFGVGVHLMIDYKEE